MRKEQFERAFRLAIGPDDLSRFDDSTLFGEIIQIDMQCSGEQQKAQHAVHKSRVEIDPADHLGGRELH